MVWPNTQFFAKCEFSYCHIAFALDRRISDISSLYYVTGHDSTRTSHRLIRIVTAFGRLGCFPRIRETIAFYLFGCNSVMPVWRVGTRIPVTFAFNFRISTSIYIQRLFKHNREQTCRLYAYEIVSCSDYRTCDRRNCLSTTR